jgi:hypothetical protein
MSPRIDRRAQLAGQAGTHALIVGISDYPHLPDLPADGVEDPARPTRLHAAAYSAFRFYTWLVANAGRLAAPLATCWVTCAPIPGERERMPRNWEPPSDLKLDDVAGPCGVNDFVAAASAWRAAALEDPDGILVLYFAGHALELASERPALVFQDFGDGVGPTLRATVDLANLREGLAPADWQPRIARRQFCFIDTSRIIDPSLPPESRSRTTPLFDVPFTPSFDDRRGCTLFATTPGGRTYTVRDGRTFFNLALIRGLEGSAAEPGPWDPSGGPTPWRITARSLVRGVQNELENLNRRVQGTQRIAWSIQGDDADLVTLDGPPTVTLRLHVEPAELRPKVVLEVRDSQLRPVAIPPFPDPNVKPGVPIDLRLPAGIYQVGLHVADAEPGQAWRQIVTVRPPGTEVVARLAP